MLVEHRQKNRVFMVTRFFLCLKTKKTLFLFVGKEKTVIFVLAKQIYIMKLELINGIIEAVQPKPKQNKKLSPIPPMYKGFEKYYYSDLREIVEERNNTLDYVASITRNINN